MKQKDRTSQKPQTSPYHEHDPLPQGALPESPAVASANECTGLMFTPPEDAAQLEDVLTGDELQVVQGGYEVKFKVVELYEQLRDWLEDQ